MADVLSLEVVTPGRLLAELGTGFLNYEAGGKRWYLAIHGGYLEILADRVRVPATAAERAEKIDVERAKAAMKHAQEQAFNASLGVDPAVALGLWRGRRRGWMRRRRSRRQAGHIPHRRCRLAGS
jgi:hypothetical protein